MAESQHIYIYLKDKMACIVLVRATLGRMVCGYMVADKPDDGVEW
jgi:hypothetical protein